MNDTPNPPSSSAKSTLSLTLDWRVVALLLLAVIAVMLYFWRPWDATAAKKTITIQGQATVQAAPDSFVFAPVFTDADVKKATAAGNEAVAQLKKLGVKDADIKTTVQSAPTAVPEPAVSSIYPPIRSFSNATYTVTVTVSDKALAQKVADYLATTTATGEITPATSFRPATATKLGLEARSQAADDAKAKAAVMAKQLGGRVGKVISISEEGSGPGIYPLSKSMSGGSATASDAVTVQPGTDSVAYSFTVVFELD